MLVPLLLLSAERYGGFFLNDLLGYNSKFERNNIFESRYNITPLYPILSKSLVALG